MATEKEVIEIDFEVHKEIEKRRESFNDTPNDVLRRILELPIIETDEKEDDVKSSDFIARGLKHGLFTKGILLPNGKKLQNESRGTIFEAEIKSGMLVFNNRAYKSLSKAACVAAGVNENGWRFWHYYDEISESWLPCSNLRPGNGNVTTKESKKNGKISLAKVKRNLADMPEELRTKSLSVLEKLGVDISKLQ